MNRKIALKRLSASDLTLFEYHYRNTPGAKQKAINLDADVFINTLFPTLPSKFDAIRDRVIVTLTIYGPNEAGSHVITRKILKQQKNWRLNGELVSNPPEEPLRYNDLAKGDYAILDFAGNPEPYAARMYLISRATPSDAELHRAFENRYGQYFSAHKGMLQITTEDLESLLSELHLPETNPILDLIESDALEDASLGGTAGITQLRKRRKARGVSREELGRARRSAEQIGRSGEEILNFWLSKNYSDSATSVIWDSEVNAVSPYDFTLVENGKPLRRIDAKSTAGDFRGAIHVSWAELTEMAEGTSPYDLYRLYSITGTTARLRIAKDVRSFASQLLKSVETLPSGVSIDSVSIKPDSLVFEDEIVIETPEDVADAQDT